MSIWRTARFIATVTLIVTPYHAMCSRQVSSVTGSIRLKAISYAEFRLDIMEAKEIYHRRIPFSFIAKALEQGPLLQRQSRKAQLIIRCSRVVGKNKNIRLTKPLRNGSFYPKDISDWLTKSG